ncbi:MAG TPA: CBS domain-containing protein [Burkholderiales bacterium]|nr:CBS domain-containing protein [Burkholderiales bacterium]
MTIGEICTRETVIATREMTVAAAAQLMRQHHVGTLVVVDPVNGGKRVPVGIITDRDAVVEVMATGLDPNAITVGDIMEQELVTARANEGVLETMQIMRYKGVRRLPIVGKAGELIGIVSIDDLLEVLAEEFSELAKIFAREQARETTTRR